MESLRLAVLVGVALGVAGTSGVGCAGAEVTTWGPDAAVDGAGPAHDAAAGDAPAVDAGAADSAPLDAGGADAARTDAAPGSDAGCTVNGTTPESCGPCGVVCPGYGQATAIVGCVPPACTFACKGANYDCNANAADGCEVADVPTADHSQATAFYLGNFSCFDGDSAQNITGLLPTDQRAHESPAIDGFDAAIGGAPDWYRIHAGGGALCQDDITLTLQVSGSATPACFRLRAITDVSTYTCQTSGSGSCSFAPGMSSYSDDTDIYVVVDKTCTGATSERVSYTITGHL